MIDLTLLLRPKHVQRFHTKYVCNLENGCWEWIAGTFSTGYGLFRVLDKCGPFTAHRVSWHIHNGPIPTGMSVLHKCDRRICMNPAHLFLGTQADNMADMVQKGRSLNGESHPLAILTEEAVVDIRSRRVYHGYQADMAREFGVTISTINQICKRKSWGHIPCPAAPSPYSAPPAPALT